MADIEIGSRLYQILVLLIIVVFALAAVYGGMNGDTTIQLIGALGAGVGGVIGVFSEKLSLGK